MRRLLPLLLLVACGAPVRPPDAGAPASGDDAGADGGPTVRHLASLSVTPTALTMQPGQAATISAIATWDDGTQSDVSGSVTWSSTSPTVAEAVVVSASANDVAVQASSPGVTDVEASTGLVHSNLLHVTVAFADGGPPPQDGGSRDGGLDGGTPDGGSVAGEVRALWVTRFAYATAADVQGLVNRAADAGFNTLYFQIRGEGDAFYSSQLAPWSERLTGTLGQDPGWDPLQTALTAAHARGLKLHAYFNVFSARSCTAVGCACDPVQSHATPCTLPPASPAGKPTHWLRAHPQSMVVDTAGMNQDVEYFWFSPADLAYRAHVIAVVDELLTNYAVDGLHLDRIRYPGPWSSYDPASVTGFAASDAGTTRADWQRENVSAMVGAIYQEVQRLRPNAVLSAAVWGIYAPLPGCSTSKGYADYFQDSLGWVHTSRIDQLVPMTYWDIGTGCTDWAKLINGFVADAGAPRVVAGMSGSDQGAFMVDKVSARIAHARMVGAAGTAIFSSAYFDTYGSWGALRADGGVYAFDAPVPPMTWR